MGKKIILIAGIGSSPAVLTETVWALAHQKKPVVPDEVVVITTTKGRDALQKTILAGGEDSVWAKLVAALGKEKIPVKGKLCFGEAQIRIIPDENRNCAEDLRTGDDSLRSADFMLRELRAYTEPPDTTVLASIAGGRKTMSALLFSCMTLVGREDDKVYHVLIPPEYECGMNPPFYFPQKGQTHEILDRNGPMGKKVKSEKIGVDLFEIPFVRMRGWYQEKFKTQPPTYQTLVSAVQSIAPRAVAYPNLWIDALGGAVRINGGKEIRMKGYNFAVLLMLANGVSNLGDIYKRLSRLVKVQDAYDCKWLYAIADIDSRFAQYDESNWRDQNQEISKIMNSLRTKLAKEGFSEPKSLVPVGNNSVTFPIDKIEWNNKEEFNRISRDIIFG